jgi:hypothetical protein
MALRDTLEAVLREYDSAKPGAAGSGAALLPYPSQHATPRQTAPPPANMATRNMPLFAILTSQARHI